jgi:hypothetical protein
MLPDHYAYNIRTKKPGDLNVPFTPFHTQIDIIYIEVLITIVIYYNLLNAETC